MTTARKCRGASTAASCAGTFSTAPGMSRHTNCRTGSWASPASVLAAALSLGRSPSSRSTCRSRAATAARRETGGLAAAGFVLNGYCGLLFRLKRHDGIDAGCVARNVPARCFGRQFTCSSWRCCNLNKSFPYNIQGVTTILSSSFRTLVHQSKILRRSLTLTPTPTIRTWRYVQRNS